MGNVKMVIKSVENKQEKSQICGLILRSLPHWFGIEKAIQEYEKGVQKLVFFAAYENERPMGMIAIKEHNEYTAEIYVMGIMEAYHKKGIGRALVTEVEEYLSKSHMRFLMVKTLSDRHPDVYYKKTRKFYQAMDFYPLEEMIELWGKENPCLLMIKTLKEKIHQRNF